MTRRVVIMGASLAGATAATTLRELGFDGTIDVIGAEPELPYERPALSETFLAGEGSRDELLIDAGRRVRRVRHPHAPGLHRDAPGRRPSPRGR